VALQKRELFQALKGTKNVLQKLYDVHQTRDGQFLFRGIVCGYYGPDLVRKIVLEKTVK
jgi:hypothetical protein